MISQELINEFIEIVREDYGVELSCEEASRIANDTVGYFDLLAKIYHEEKENHTGMPP